jgi:cytochrome o ubiquinol oxidase subunit 2
MERKFSRPPTRKYERPIWGIGEWISFDHALSRLIARPLFNLGSVRETMTHKSGRRIPIIALLRLFAISLVAPLAACSEGVLNPQGPIGASEKIILFDATGIMLAVVIPVILLTIGFAWWFRVGNRRATYLPNWEYSGRIEVIVWCIPALVVLFLGGVAWIASHDLDPPKPIVTGTRAIDVEVISLDWKWLFIYPNEGIASVNRLVVPVGTPIRFRLTSTSVMNSFFIPQLGSQIYTMPGMTTRLYLQADHVGMYRGISAQFSGDGFSDMQFDVSAVSPNDFASWVRATKAKGGELDAGGFSRLKLPSEAVKPITFASVSPGLFDSVTSEYVATSGGMNPEP